MIRPPTDEELRELKAYLYEVAGESISEDEDVDIIENATIAVEPDYISDGPGYAGKIMMVVWSGSPNQYNVFVWRNGQIQEAEDHE